MSKRFRIFCPVATLLLLAPAFLFPCLHDVQFAFRNRSDLVPALLADEQQGTREPESDVQLDLKDILTPLDWVARGGCWSFSDKIIAAQGVHARGLALFYYNKRTFGDFIFEAKLNKLAEDGPFGLLLRYDEKTKEGYLYLLFPHGDYGLRVLKNERDYAVFSEPAINMNQGTNVWNTIKIVCRGANFDLYMNDHRLTSITDHTYVSGRVGFFLGSDPRQKALFEIVTLKSL